ncbi:FGGY family carbohydrate kinase [Haloferula sp. BvORR071]|uniref:xylulokinase n=1 Tax=Haloferula sp. BvORR071 TaxID=1396141 RepID=UPI0005500FF4|nr:FGGY family carbohydrate kinase [Haloferula sp. BvORR071]
MFLGLDSSTQSLSAIVIDPASGQIVREVSVNFGAALPAYNSPSGFIPGGKDGEVHADPRMWLDALDLALKQLADGFDLSKIEAIASSGQQHGSVYLDARFEQRLADLDSAKSLKEQVAPALTRATAPIWMDTSTGAECAEIAAAAGGNAEVCRISGSIAIERFTGPQIRRFYKQDPTAYERTSVIHLVSSFIGSVLAGKNIEIDHGDGAGMNLLNLHSLDWDDTLLDATAPGLRGKLPPAATSTTIAGFISPYFAQKYGFSSDCQIVLSTGDNPSSLVGMGATTPGTMVISLGTSDTFFAAMEKSVTDPQGFGHVFGNPAGGFMSLICFRNGSLAREALRDVLGLDWSAFDRSGLAATPAGNDGNLMLPFFGPEITPRRDFSAPIRKGSTEFEAGGNPPAQVRAVLEGQFLNMRLHSQWIGEKAKLIRLTGGASQNDGIAQLVANIFQAPVERFAIANGAGLGAALRAAHALGHDLTALQASFCKPAAGSRLEPDASLAGTYDQALAGYKALLSA